MAVFAFACVIPSILIGGEMSDMGSGIMVAIYLIGIGLMALIYAYAARQVYLFALNIALSILTPLLVFAVAGGLSAFFAIFFSDGDEMVTFCFVTIVCLYIFFMLLKKHVFTQWHDK